MKKVCLFLLSVFLVSCASQPELQVRKARTNEPIDYEKIKVIDPDVRLASNGNVGVSAFGYNPRKWEASKLQIFNFPILWLKDPQLLSKNIYIVKQVGRSILFCLIEVDEKGAREERKSKADYSLFLIKISDARLPINWEEYLEQKYQSNYFSHRVVDVGQRQVVELNWNTNHYWNAPTILVQNGEQVHEMIMLYQGTSRTYVNQIMNKFPWRAVTLN